MDQFYPLVSLKFPFPYFQLITIRPASNAQNWKKKTLSIPFSRFQLGKFYYYIRNMSIMKNLTNFHKTVETGVDPCLYMQLYQLNQDFTIKDKIELQCSILYHYRLFFSWNKHLIWKLLTMYLIMTSLSPG